VVLACGDWCKIGVQNPKARMCKIGIQNPNKYFALENVEYNEFSHQSSHTPQMMKLISQNLPLI